MFPSVSLGCRSGSNVAPIHRPSGLKTPPWVGLQGARPRLVDSVIAPAIAAIWRGRGGLKRV